MEFAGREDSQMPQGNRQAAGVVTEDRFAACKQAQLRVALRGASDER